MLVLSAYTATTSVGPGLASLRRAVAAQAHGLVPCRIDLAGAAVELPTYVGQVAGLDQPLPPAWAGFDCRNNRLAALALEQDEFLPAVASAIRRYGSDRIAVILGTSTSGILATERAYQRRDTPERLPADFHYAGTQNNYSLAGFVGSRLGLNGPTFVISTACSSSAKVFAAAARLMAAGCVDAAVVGGVDSLCMTTLYGFSSLELTSPEPSRPFGADRSGISIGEGAGFALLERPEHAERHTGIGYFGAGESADAYHMSTPHPEGLGAELAMRRALDAAGLTAADIGYVNVHGTGTRTNDASEGKAIRRVLGGTVPASGVKGMVGHLLGAAGITEIVVSALALTDGSLPGTVNTVTADPEIGVNLLTANLPAPGTRFALSNSFGFGGNNCAVIVGRVEASGGPA